MSENDRELEVPWQGSTQFVLGRVSFQDARRVFRLHRGGDLTVKPREGAPLAGAGGNSRCDIGEEAARGR